MDTLLLDIRYAFRHLRHSPGFAVAAVLTLALGIGANTTIFSVVNGLLLRPLPVKDPARLVFVTDSLTVTDTGATRVRVWDFAVWEQIRQRPQLFEAVAAWSFTRFNLASGGETQFIDGLWASGSFFETLGVPAVLGRSFSDRDDRPGGGPDGPIAVISYAFWHRRYGGAADVIGRAVRLNDVPFTIVGVTPPEFFGGEVGRTFDVILPLQTEPLIRGRDSALDNAGANFLTVIGRLKPGHSLGNATAELRRVQSEIREAALGPSSSGLLKDVVERYLRAPFTLTPGATGFSNLRLRYERPLWIVAVVVALVLLIACVNVANLLLARAITRRHELSVRRALGASRGRLARQLFTESVLLSSAGAALGLFIAAYGSDVLVHQLSTATNIVFLDVSVDGPVLCFTLAVTALTALLFGTAPALRAALVAPIEALKYQGRAATEHARGGLMGWLVVAQVALSLVLVVAAGLFIQSFASLASRHLGFQPDQILVVIIDPQRTRVDPAQRVPLYDRARSAVLELPNVADAAISHLTPVGGGGFTPAVEISGVLPSGNQVAPAIRVPANGEVFGNLISPRWFGTFGTPLVAGRDFTDSDRKGAPRVAIVNQAFARKFAGGGNPLGRTITVYPNSPRALGPIEIVGVAADAVYTSPREPAPPTWYVPIAQFDVAGFPFASARLSVRAERGSPALLTKSIAAAIATVNPQLALTFRPLADQVHASLTQERLMSQLAGLFGALALLLAGIGLYGVTAYAISSRRTEIGIRMALGATPAGVIRLVLARVSKLVGVGIVAGVGVSLWASRFVAGLIYDLPLRDPTTLAGAALVLAAIGGLAGWLPARRAARVDPVVALRAD